MLMIILESLKIMSVWEWVGTVFGVAGVLLTSKRSIWCWPIWIVSIVAYGIFFTDIKLYADACLQVFFLVTSAIAWVSWSREIRLPSSSLTSPGHDQNELSIVWSSPRERIGVLVLTVVSSAMIGFVFDRFTDAHVPYWDAGCAGISVAAQILMMNRRVDAWVLWMLVDFVYVALYITKAAYLTAILYGIFTVVALAALREWQSVYRRQHAGN